MEKFPEVVKDSPYKEKLLVFDVADENLHQTVQESNFSYELVIGFGDLINAFIDPVLHKQAYRSLDIFMRK